MKLLKAIGTFAAIAAIAFFFANIFIDGLVAEMELREQHNRIHWRGAR